MKRKTWLSRVLAVTLAVILTLSTAGLSSGQVYAEEGQAETKAIVTIQTEDDLKGLKDVHGNPCFQDAAWRTVVFNAVKNGQDNAAGGDLYEALANFTGDIKANKKGIVDVHGLDLLRKANFINLEHNEIKDWSYLGVNSGNANYESWYGLGEDEDVTDRDQGNNVYWSLGGNPFEKLPGNFGGKLVIKQAATTNYQYPEDLGELFVYVRSETDEGKVSGTMNVAKTKLYTTGTKERNAKLESVGYITPEGMGYDPLNITGLDAVNNEYATFDSLAKSSSIVKLAIGITQELHYWTSDESGTITPGSQSFKYYLTNRFQIYDKVTVSEDVETSGEIILNKKDKDDKPLEGAEYELYKADNTRVDTYTTDTTGKISIPNMPLGDYYFKETKAPEGYLVDSEPKHFTLGTSGSPNTVLGGGVTEVTPTDGSAAVTAADNERFMVGPNKMDPASPDITLTAGSGATITKVTVESTLDEDGTSQKKTEEFTTLNDAAAAINAYKNNNLLRGGVSVRIEHQTGGTGAIQAVVDVTDEPILKKDITVTKKWTDNTGWQGTHPDITIRLLRNGTEVEKVILKDPTITHTFTNLPKTDQNGKEYVYSVTEDTIVSQDKVEGYLTSIKANGDNFDIKNTWSVKDRIHILGEKKWDDNNDQLGKRPDHVTFVLKQDGTEYLTATATIATNWKFEFKDVPLYYPDEDKAYTYTIEEKGDLPIEYSKPEAVSVKTEGLQHLDEASVTVTNTLAPTPKVELVVEKTWSDYADAFGKRPASIKVELMRNDVSTGTIQTVTPDANGKWLYTFKDLDQYDENRVDYVYTVRETSVLPDYAAAVTVDANKATITNTLKPELNKMNLEGEKTWNDYKNVYKHQPTSIEVELMKDGKATGTKKTVTKAKDGTWKYTFEDLDKYDNEGKEITYTVKENNAPKVYTAEVKGMNIVNTLDPELNLIELKGKKIWEDNKDANKQRPGMIKVELLKNGEATGNVKEVTPDKEGTWSYRFEKLERYNSEGVENIYTIRENDVPTGYLAAVSGTDIINTLNPKENETSVKGEKIWKDYNNALKTRPESVEITLLQNGKEFKTAKVSAGDKDPWKYSFDTLPKYDKAGTPYVYKVKETKVPHGYTSVVATDNSTITNILDSKANEVVSISLKKEWKGDKGNEKKRPTVSISVLQNGKEIRKVVLNVDKDWKATLKELPKYTESGEEYKYTVKEAIVSGYKQTNLSWKHNDKENTWTGVFTNTKVEPVKKAPTKPATKTGDTLGALPYIMIALLISALAIVFVAVRKFRKKKK